MGSLLNSQYNTMMLGSQFTMQHYTDDGSQANVQYYTMMARLHFTMQYYTEDGATGHSSVFSATP